MISTPKTETSTSAISRSKTDMEIQTSPILAQNITHSDGNLSATFQQSLSSPLNKTEEQVHTDLTKRKLNFAQDESTITFRTRGQPIYLRKIIKARKKSNLAPSPLKGKRAKPLPGVRNFIAGIGSEAHHTQQSSELKLFGHKAKVNVCGKAGIQPRNFMTKRVALAIKTSLGLSWTQHRLQKCILKKEVVLPFEGEAKERQERNKMLAGNLKEDKISAVEKMRAKTKKISLLISRHQLFLLKILPNLPVNFLMNTKKVIN